MGKTYNSLHEFFIDNKISDERFGFLRIGTRNALNAITEMLQNNLDANKPAIATFFDLAKAFDTVDHKILMQKANRISLLKLYYNI